MRLSPRRRENFKNKEGVRSKAHFFFRNTFRVQYTVKKMKRKIKGPLDLSVRRQKENGWEDVFMYSLGLLNNVKMEGNFAHLDREINKTKQKNAKHAKKSVEKRKEEKTTR